MGFCISWEMKDSVGVNIGHCTDCGVDELCSNYKIQINTDVCRYCGCFPAEHAKIPEKIMQAKKQNEDLRGATYNDLL